MRISVVSEDDRDLGVRAIREDEMLWLNAVDLIDWLCRREAEDAFSGDVLALRAELEGALNQVGNCC